MSDISSRITVDIQQIAEIAGVGRSAVGNWRKRHADFPVPDSSGGFDLRQVERWLIENGKIDKRVPAEFVAWSLADNLRSFLSSTEVTRFLVAALVYLEACDSTAHPDGSVRIEVDIAPADVWNEVRRTPADSLGTALLTAATRIEAANPLLDGLLVPGLSSAASVDGRVLSPLFENLVAATDEITPRFALFEEVVSRAGDLDRFRGEFSTPDVVTELMVRLAGRHAGTVCDPACGEGGLLLSAAIHPGWDDPKPTRLVGFEINADILRTARSRFFLYGVSADLRHGDVFRIPADELPKSDLVLLDPPLGQKDWGDADVYLDERWTYGVPPRTSADLAWIQLAVQCLDESGSAIVVTTTGPTFRGGPEAQIRRAMLEAGVVEAVVQLPSRLRADTSIPLVLWILQSPRPGIDQVLFVDASTLGTTSRSQHTLDESDIERVVMAVRAYRDGGAEDPEIAWSMGIGDLIVADANLDPTRYRPVADVDVDEVRRRADELRLLIPATSVEASEAIDRLVTRLTEGRRR